MRTLLCVVRQDLERVVCAVVTALMCIIAAYYTELSWGGVFCFLFPGWEIKLERNDKKIKKTLASSVSAEY